MQKREYEQLLSKAGHEVVLEYKETAQNNENFNSGTSRKRKKRKGRKCIWFNPPHSDTVSSDIGRLFLNAVEKHFSGDKFLRKLFNKNNIKVSYSCGRNVKQEIQGNNKKVLQEHWNNILQPVQEDRMCSCPRNKICPFNGECLRKNLVYKATVSCQGKKDMIYIGQTTTTFKARLSNHTTSFKKAYKRRHCSLATYIWDLKLENKQWQIKWEKVKECKLYSRESKKCDLCDSEKNEILDRMVKDLSTVINTRNEFMTPCTHKSTELLSHQTTVNLANDPLNNIGEIVVAVQQENRELRQKEVSETSHSQNHDALHQSEGPEAIPTALSDTVHQLDVAEGSQGSNCGPFTHTGVMVHSAMSQHQSGIIEQVQQDIDIQYLQNMDSQMLTRRQRAMLVREELEKTDGFFDPG